MIANGLVQSKSRQEDYIKLKNRYHNYSKRKRIESHWSVIPITVCIPFLNEVQQQDSSPQYCYYYYYCWYYCIQTTTTTPITIPTTGR